MFAREHKQEYDPASVPVIERPLATGRPLTGQVQSNAFGNRGLEGFHKELPQDTGRFSVYSPTRSPTKETEQVLAPISPSKGQISPAKSSLSNRSRFTAQEQASEIEIGPSSEDEDSSAERQLPPGRSLHRHAKSVTFDAAPPQVNEYEMTTPDPSSVASGSRDGSYDSAEDGEEDDSFDRGSSIERDDSFDASLEDTDKTPVVLPEDWRFMSPGLVDDSLAAHVEDPFNGEQSSPAPTARPTSAAERRPTPSRTDSTNSNGERRPLPPLPASIQRTRSDSNDTLSATAEKFSSAQRGLPSPPRPASISKAEIQGMGGCSMSLQERLRLMMLQDEDKDNSVADLQSEQRFQVKNLQDEGAERKGNERGGDIPIYQDHEETDDFADLGEYKLPPRISRESILRKVKGQARDMDEMNFDFSSPAPSSSPDRKETADYDPDTPLPSLEGQSLADDADTSIVIKQEDEEDEVDVYSIPELYSQAQYTGPSQAGYEEEESVVRHTPHEDNDVEDDDESRYSHGSTDDEQATAERNDANEDKGHRTPRALTPTRTFQDETKSREHKGLSLPEFALMLGDHDLGLGLGEYLRTSPPAHQQGSMPNNPPTITALRETLRRPMTAEKNLEPLKLPEQVSEAEEGPKTPDSVIRHPVEGESPSPASPSVPEPMATIKAPGGRLKTRPSATPSDIAAMATVRRQISGSQPNIPPIPERHRDRPIVNEEPDATGSEQPVEYPMGTNDKQMKRKSSLVQLEVPVNDMDEGLSFGLDKEFDRVIEAQKVAFDLSPTCPGFSLGASPGAEYIGGQGFCPLRGDIANKVIRTQKGYLMRQNTKLVVATSNAHEPAPETFDTEALGLRGTKSAGNSPRKASQTQTWTTEPWNGKARRKSVRQSVGSPHKKPVSGPAPPLPGQQSNVASGLGRVARDVSVPVAEEVDEGVERGRLFVKVVGVKDLELPLPRGKMCLSNPGLLVANVYRRALVLCSDPGQRSSLRDDRMAGIRKERSNRPRI